jgi:tRNA(Ile)-lysidine synthase
MSSLTQIEAFLLKSCPTSAPLLLALSGGPDSLYLFYVLLSFRTRYRVPFHVAHVNHGWRPESSQEADALRELALQYQVPFHLKVLQPHFLEGNLEAACREERYTFFAQLSQQIPYQGVLTGHHLDDQAETIFKRLLEGAHWSRWVGLQRETWIKGVRILRPLLNLTKNEIQKALAKENIQAFEDPSNRHLQFLRARLRETIFPRLNREFGKQIQKNLSIIGKEAQELTEYFDERLSPLLKLQVQGPWGKFLDLQKIIPTLSLLEIKYLLRGLCKQQGFFLSREMIEQAARSLKLGKANQLLTMGLHQIRVDRRHLFILSSRKVTESLTLPLPLQPGKTLLGNSWQLKIEEDVYLSHQPMTSWKEGWTGYLRGYLPQGNYTITLKGELDKKETNIALIKKRWSQAKVPAFLYPYFPLISIKQEVCHEFLTGRPLIPIPENTPCWKIELFYA